MSDTYVSQSKATARINLALQGGGSHGAFTWGVLDRIFEDGRIEVAAISGTSAGAMNAVVASQGMYKNGGKGARDELEAFWHAVSVAGQASPLRRSFFDVMRGTWSLDSSPAYLWLDLLGRLASPYDLNPFNYNPLRDLVEGFIDFDKVRHCQNLPIYISATNVETGKVRIFDRSDISLDAVMASACLPLMFQAVEIDGVPYWDGGYMGNPVLSPFIKHGSCNDIVVVQINPVERKGTPRTARDILNRVNEITFNASLLKELRSIDKIDRLIDSGALSPEDYRRMFLHIIEATDEMNELEASSKLNSEWAFLLHLKEIGRAAADRWLEAHFRHLGEQTTINLRAMFDATKPGAG